MMTLPAFLRAYGAILARHHDLPEVVFQDVIEQAETTIVSGRGGWTHTTPAATDAWQKIGGIGNPTMKGLRALPRS